MLATTHTLEVHWSATHVVVALPSWHHEAKIHGHNWAAELHVTGPGEELAQRDWTAAEAELRLWAQDTLDHRHLNEVMDNRTTEEDVAVWLYEQWAPRIENLAQVRISARPNEWTGYTPATSR